MVHPDLPPTLGDFSLRIPAPTNTVEKADTHEFIRASRRPSFYELLCNPPVQASFTLGQVPHTSRRL
jgi:hypothetical protein